MEGDFDQINSFFRHADEDTRNELAKLEKDLKKNKLFTDLVENHDGIKAIVDLCRKKVDAYNRALRDQTSEQLANESERVKRAGYEAYRDTWAWFVNLFVVHQAKLESNTKKVEKIEEHIAQITQP